MKALHVQRRGRPPCGAAGRPACQPQASGLRDRLGPLPWPCPAVAAAASGSEAPLRPGRLLRRLGLEPPPAPPPAGSHPAGLPPARPPGGAPSSRGASCAASYCRWLGTERIIFAATSHKNGSTISAGSSFPRVRETAIFSTFQIQ